MLSVLGVIVSIIVGIDVLVHWVLGWRYLFSPAFRRSMEQRWRSKSPFFRAAERAFAVLCFLTVNAVVAAVLWRIFVGPLKPVHQWNV